MEMNKNVLRAMTAVELEECYLANLEFWNNADKAGRHTLAEYFDDRCDEIEKIYFEQTGESLCA